MHVQIAHANYIYIYIYIYTYVHIRKHNNIYVHIQVPAFWKIDETWFLLTQGRETQLFLNRRGRPVGGCDMTALKFDLTTHDHVPEAGIQLWCLVMIASSHGLGQGMGCPHPISTGDPWGLNEGYCACAAPHLAGGRPRAPAWVSKVEAGGLKFNKHVLLRELHSTIGSLSKYSVVDLTLEVTPFSQGLTFMTWCIW